MWFVVLKGFSVVVFIQSIRPTLVISFQKVFVDCSKYLILAYLAFLSYLPVKLYNETDLDRHSFPLTCDENILGNHLHYRSFAITLPIILYDTCTHMQWPIPGCLLVLYVISCGILYIYLYLYIIVDWHSV